MQTRSEARNALASEGLPFTLVSTSASIDPIAWLGTFEENARLFREMRPDLPEDISKALNSAENFVRLAQASIKSGAAREAAFASMRAVHSVWWIEIKLGVIPRVRRDFNLQMSKRKAKRPELDKWIDQQFSADPTLKSPELWSRLPQRFKDNIGEDRFSKRVTAGRKRRM
jgi:hypothetical protein